MLLAVLAGFTHAAKANQITEIDDRLFDVEEKLGGKYPMTSIDAKKSRFGGAMKFEFTMVKSETVDSIDKTRVSQQDLQVDDTITTMNNRMDLFFAGDITDNLEYLLVPSFWHNTYGDDWDSAARTYEGDRWTEMIVYRMWGMYKTSFGNFKFGRMLAPFGTYSNTYSPIAERVPFFPESMLRGASHGIFFDFILDGVQYQKQFRLGSSKLNIQAYSGVSAVLSSEVVNEVDLSGNPEDINVGARIGFTTLGDKIDVGASIYHGRRRSSFTNYAFDTTMRFGRFGLKGEYQMSKENTFSGQGCSAKQVADAVYRVAVYNDVLAALGSAPSEAIRVSGGDPNLDCTDNAVKAYNLAKTATGSSSTALLAYLSAAATSALRDTLVSNKSQYYIEPTFQITDKLMLAGRYDWFDANTEAIFMGGEKTVYALSLHYKPNPLVNFQITAAKHDFEAGNGKNAVFRALDDLATGAQVSDGTALNLSAVGALGNPAAGAASYAAMKNALLTKEDVIKVISKANTNPDFMQYYFNVVFSF